MALVFVFLLCLYISAWQDAKSGAVDLRLLLTSVAVTVLLANGHLQIPAAIAVFAGLSVLALLKKMGGADVIIFTQITLLFGFCKFGLIIFLASLLALLWLILEWTAARVRNKTFEISGREIRYIPFIALAASIALVMDLVTARI